MNDGAVIKVKENHHLFQREGRWVPIIPVEDGMGFKWLLDRLPTVEPRQVPDASRLACPDQPFDCDKHTYRVAGRSVRGGGFRCESGSPGVAASAVVNSIAARCRGFRRSESGSES